MSHVVVLSEVPAQVAAYTLPVGIAEAIAAMAEFPADAADQVALAADQVALAAGHASAASGHASAANASRIAAEAAVASLSPGTVAVYTPVTANIALESGKQYRLCATSGAITLTLPASPANGATIRIVDGETIGNGPTYTLARNGQTIMTLAEDMVLDLAGGDLEIWFNGTTWRLF